MEIRDTRNGDWHWVYNAVLADPHLTEADKVVYSAISTFGGHQTIHPTLEQIGSRCNVSERQVRYSLRQLEEVEYISVEKSTGRGNANVYFLLKAPKGCKLCPFYKGGKLEPQKGQIETLKGEPTAPHIYSIDNKKDIYILPENEKPKKEPKPTLGGFESWFTSYPNRTRKAEASAVWRDMSQEERDAASKDTEGRSWGDPKFIPSALNYLKGKRWLDEKPAPRKIMSFGNKK